MHLAVALSWIFGCWWLRYIPSKPILMEFLTWINDHLFRCFSCISVVSNSVWPHRWQPTRLPRPWDSLGKNTGVVCHFLLQCMKVKSESEVAQSCPTLSDPMDCSPPGSSVHGISQARVPEWGAIAFSFKKCSVSQWLISRYCNILAFLR